MIFELKKDGKMKLLQLIKYSLNRINKFETTFYQLSNLTYTI